jgi:putative nucleotidyltransferase with HDIG domain
MLALHSPPRALVLAPGSAAASAMFAALGRTLATRDRATHDHSVRVQRYAAALARQADVPNDLLAAIDTAALLHDIGKLGIPDQLLHKPGPLTLDEYDEVKQHAVFGAEILEAAACPGPLASLVRHHHENWDGSGYPDGLAGDTIPMGSRVLAVADCYDALTSDRPYRRAVAHHSAVAMIFERRGTMFDPAITDAFLQIVWRLGSAAATELAQKQYAHVPFRRQLAARAI